MQRAYPEEFAHGLREWAKGREGTDSKAAAIVFAETLLRIRRALGVKGEE